MRRIQLSVREQEMNTFNSNVLLGNGIFLLVIAIVTCLTNGTLLVTIYRNPLCCFRTTSGVLIAALGVTNIMTGVITASNVGISNILNSQGLKSCHIRGILQEHLVSQFTVRCGIFCITAMSFDRLITVMFPRFYRNHITTKVTKGVAYLVCLVVLLISIMEVLIGPVPAFNKVALYGLFVAPFALITLNFIATYATIKLHFYIVKKTVFPLNSERTQCMRCLKKEADLFGTTALVFVGFVISCCPWLVVLAITTYWPLYTKESWYFVLQRSSYPFLYLNTVINPVIYACRIRKYRTSILKAILGRRLSAKKPKVVWLNVKTMKKYFKNN